MAKLKIKNTNGVLNPVDINQSGGGNKMIDVVDGLAYDVQIQGSLDVEELTVNGSPAGGASYLVYTALLGQIADGALIVNELANTLEAGSWTRNSIGNYTCPTTTVWVDNKIHINGIIVGGGTGGNYIPIYSGTDIVGFYAISAYDDTTVGLTLYIKAEDGSAADLSYIFTGIANSTRLALPEIRFYQ